MVAREIETHLQDQYDALVRGRMGEEEAIDESIRQMGDAVEIGTSLDRVHRPKPSWSLLVLTGILLLAGLGIHIFITYDSDFSGRLLFRLIAALLYGLRGKRYLGLALALVGLAVPCAFCAIIPCVAGLLITAAAWGTGSRSGKGAA